MARTTRSATSSDFRFVTHLHIENEVRVVWNFPIQRPSLGFRVAAPIETLHTFHASYARHCELTLNWHRRTCLSIGWKTDRYTWSTRSGFPKSAILIGWLRRSRRRRICSSSSPPAWWCPHGRPTRRSSRYGHDLSLTWPARMLLSSVRHHRVSAE